MSWFARSITNTFLPDPSSTPPAETQPGSDSEPDSASPKGVKEDISELTKTLTRQLWGVASFLAPPPQSDLNPSDPDPNDSETSGIDGIRSDFAEIGGRFRSGISKIASEFFREEEEWDEGEEVVGVTEEVLAFARNIAMHPETWLDFPLLPEEDESDDFDMSNAQQEHALAVERLAPRLAALRIELCPSHMSEGCFWKIYFVLLHPRLNKEDAERLSTPQVVEARALLLQDLQKRTKSGSFVSGSSMSQGKESESPSPSAEQKEATVSKAPPLEEPTTTSSASPDTETDKHPVVTTEIKIVDKSVIEEEVPKQTKSPSSDASKVPIERYEDDADDWLHEDEGTEIDRPNITPIPIGDEDDVSFSDLEDDDDQIAPSSSQKGSHSGSSQLKDSKDWIELNKGSRKSSGDKKSTIPKNESNEWLDVDDIDLA